MKRMFLDIDKAQKLSELTGNCTFEEKRAAAGRQMKSSPILGHPNNSFLTHGRRFQSSPIGRVNRGVGNTGENGIALNNVKAVCTDNAAYYKAAFRILQPIMPNAVHVCCLAHVLNLVGDVFAHWTDFSEVATLVWSMKSVFFKNQLGSAGKHFYVFSF